ncbi:putative mechanosensitive ion channel MscS, LSM domain protein [Sesbania bispinosa]|nr:putative mechanosensitive ion channel MscS, LSM domain protein [Sesbania bispinosa]
MKGKGNDFVRDKHNSSCKSSSSSSIARRMLCDCGEERQMTCNFFKWADGVVCDMQQPRFEDCHFYKDEIEELKRKVTKLRKKLGYERVKLKDAFACIILLLVIAVGVSVYAVVNFEGMCKRV